MPAAAAIKNPQSEIQSIKLNVVLPTEVETKKAKDIMAKLVTDASAATELATLVKTNGILSLKPAMDVLKRDMSKKNAVARSGAIATIVALTNESLEGQTETFMIPFVAQFLELQADKRVKHAAKEAVKNIIAKVNPMPPL
jgi:hypothetical protein